MSGLHVLKFYNTAIDCFPGSPRANLSVTFRRGKLYSERFLGAILANMVIRGEINTFEPLSIYYD